MGLKIRTGGVYKDSRGYEILIVMKHPDGVFRGANDVLYLADGRSRQHAYKDDDPWRLVAKVERSGETDA